MQCAVTALRSLFGGRIGREARFFGGASAARGMVLGYGNNGMFFLRYRTSGAI